jgi:hypothetical protein
MADSDLGPATADAMHIAWLVTATPGRALSHFSWQELGAGSAKSGHTQALRATARMAEVDYTVERVAETVDRLREMSPLWEMVQEGIDLRTVSWAGH